MPAAPAESSKSGSRRLYRPRLIGKSSIVATRGAFVSPCFRGTEHTAGPGLALSTELRGGQIGFGGRRLPGILPWMGQALGPGLFCGNVLKNQPASFDPALGDARRGGGTFSQGVLGHRPQAKELGSASSSAKDRKEQRTSEDRLKETGFYLACFRTPGRLCSVSGTHAIVHREGTMTP